MASASLTSPGGAPRPMLSGPFRYANAQDLPSYPSPGLKEGGAAASAAATLGWASSAGAPASLPSNAGHALGRESQAGTPGPKDALLAAGWAQRHQKQQPSSPPSAWVSTAANMAFRASNTPPPATERPLLARQDSMQAAKGAMAGPRPRAISSPNPVRKDDSNQHNAANLAVTTHSPLVRASSISAGDAGAVPYTTMDRQMFTSNPPVKPETDEQNRAYVLHASALAMAKKMYDLQQKQADSLTPSHARSSSFSNQGPDGPPNAGGERQTPVAFNSLQEAAYRLAQERLAKLQEEHQRQRGLQEYYGSPGGAQRTRLGTIKGKLTRRRSSSDGDLIEDRWRSEHIRKQMSLLDNKLAEVDEEKRTRDREALLAAAQRNVKAQMQEMDEKMHSETGKLPQTTMDDWGRKARVAAQARFDAGNENAGKVDIGGGKFMDRSEVDKIAAKKVQPLLDEINEIAEKEKERIELERVEEERRREEAEKEKMREKEIQEIHRKLKEQQKDDERARKAEIKHDEKVRRDEAKALKAEQKHGTNDGQQTEPPAATEKTDEPEQPTQTSRNTTTGHTRALSVPFAKRHRQHQQKPPQDAKETAAAEKPESETSPTHKVRSWLRNRLISRPRAATSPSIPSPQQQDSFGSSGSDGVAAKTQKERGFIGGVALARMEGRNISSPSVHNRTEQDKGKGKEVMMSGGRGSGDLSMREVAMAGLPRSQSRDRTRSGGEVGESSASAAPLTPPALRPVSQASVPMTERSERLSVSSLSSSSGDEKFVEARSEIETSVTLTPPRVRGPAAGRISPFRESRFSEILD